MTNSFSPLGLIFGRNDVQERNKKKSALAACRLFLFLFYLKRTSCSLSIKEQKWSDIYTVATTCVKHRHHVGVALSLSFKKERKVKEVRKK